MRDLSALYDRDRLTTYPRLLVIAYAVTFVALFGSASFMAVTSGKPLGADYITFWSAGRLALAGNAVGAFDFATLFEMQRVAVPTTDKLFAWHYPPTFHLVAMALAFPPYLISYVAFVALSLVAYVTALRPLVPWREADVLLLALPGTMVCALHGQNSMITAALLAVGILQLDRRPVLAGICIGLLAYKPQMGVLFPLVLALTGRWTAMAAAAAVVTLFGGVSLLVFGPDLWAAFIKNLAVVRDVMETGQLPWGKIPSAFIFLRKLGIGQDAAYAGQSVIAVAAIAGTLWVWQRTQGGLMAGATLIAGTMLITPYTFDYELAIMAVPLAIIARQLVQDGATPLEKAGLVACALSPGLMPLFDGTPIQVGFLALLATFSWSARLALTRHVPAGAGGVAGLPAPMTTA